MRVRHFFLLVLLLPAVAIVGTVRAVDIPPTVLPPARIHYDDGQDPIGNRLFHTTTTRTQISLAGLWKFQTDPAAIGEADGWQRGLPAPETSLRVPGTWNAEARYWQYVGPAWLQRNFDVSRDGTLVLSFRGVFYRSKVWLDDELLGEHEGGYTPFSYAVHVTRGDHRITVLADNRLDSTTLPKRDSDWFPYGGIYRAAYAELVPPACRLSGFNVVASRDGSGAKLDVRVNLEIAPAGMGKHKLEFFVDGKRVHIEEREFAVGTPAARFEARIDNVRLWSPQAPELYSARVLLDGGSAGADDQFVRFGVRSVAVRGSQFIVNGSPFKLRGINRHDEHPDWGSAVPAALEQRDAEIILRAGANAVRSHYPPSELFLDYCDQAGLFLMDEVPAWQLGPRNFAGGAMAGKIKTQFSAMVERDISHPSLFSWSLGNEWHDPDALLDVTRQLVDYARGVDRTHPLTLVTGEHHPVKMQALLDFAGVNWGQYEWYDEVTYLDKREGEQTREQLRSLRQLGKPVVLTEFGGAESQAGWHNWGNVKWSEEYQAANVEDSGRFGLEESWLSGGCAWQFADSRTAPERILQGRLHGWNAKGLVDGYRNPKLAYYALQRLFRGQ